MQADTDGSGQLSIAEFYEFQRQAMLRKQEEERAQRGAGSGGGGGGEGDAERRLDRIEAKLDTLAAAVAQLRPVGGSR